MKKLNREEKKYYETKSFKKEYDEWNKRLHDSGFQDVETDYDRKHRTGRMNYFDVDPVRLAYHERCEALLQQGLITDPINLFIFEKHCEGMSNRDITTCLRAVIGPTDTRTVDRRLNKMLLEADIKPLRLYR
jgi:hypothetical protein